MRSPSAGRVQIFRALTDGVPGVEYRRHSDLLSESGAIFSRDGRYRYLLWRQWAPPSNVRFCAFLMLNPSIANESEPDATIKRCVRLASNWGHTGIVVANLFGLVSKDPSELTRSRDPEGPHNRLFVDGMMGEQSVVRVVLAWGSAGNLHERSQSFLVEHAAWEMYCIDDPTKESVLTRLGDPRHPVRLSLRSVPRRLVVARGRLELEGL